MKEKKLIPLTTPYAVGDPPHSYHPDPKWVRENFVILNGRWKFSVERESSPSETLFSGEILVPFPPESALSGVQRITRPGEILLYTRKFKAEKHRERRILLHFGAVDQEAEVYLNGMLAGRHTGGYLPFSFDITSLISSGENTLTVRVRDSLDHTYPYGKQKFDRGGMWYTPVSGIWQTVYLEEVPEVYLESVKIDTTLDTVTFTVEGGGEEKVISFGGTDYPFTGKRLEVTLGDPKLWTPETPHLYPFTLTSGEDRVSSYFALRTVSVDRSGEHPRLALNGKPYFFHGLLDQGYYPDGLFLPASPEGYREDILKMKSLGFNLLRKHIKIEPAIFYYYCDYYGMAVFQDMVNNGSYSFFYDTALPTAGLKKLPRSEPKAVREVFYETAKGTVKLLYNHPSIVYYTVFNEGWGEHDPKKAYETLLPLDPSRIWDTASGWFKTKYTDVQSEHVYFKRADFKLDPEKPAVLSEFGGYSCSLEGHVASPDDVYGYKICPDCAALTRDLKSLYLDEILPLVQRGLSAAVLTQVSDVEDETNGLLTYDRRVIKPDPEVMKEIARRLKAENDPIQ